MYVFIDKAHYKKKDRSEVLMASLLLFYPIDFTKNKNSPPTSLSCGMNCKIHVTSVVGRETVSPTDMK